jgi:hypothetical protein
MSHHKKDKHRKSSLNHDPVAAEHTANPADQHVKPGDENLNVPSGLQQHDAEGRQGGYGLKADHPRTGNRGH